MSCALTQHKHDPPPAERVGGWVHHVCKQLPTCDGVAVPWLHSRDGGPAQCMGCINKWGGEGRLLGPARAHTANCPCVSPRGERTLTTQCAAVWGVAWSVWVVTGGQHSRPTTASAAAGSGPESDSWPFIMYHKRVLLLPRPASAVKGSGACCWCLEGCGAGPGEEVVAAPCCAGSGGCWASRRHRQHGHLLCGAGSAWPPVPATTTSLCWDVCLCACVYTKAAPGSCQRPSVDGGVCAVLGWAAPCQHPMRAG
jgi:hypothetical protein